MLEGFEEAFVDAQSRVVSLCLELLNNSEKKADKIYIYLFQNDDEDYIDAFFEKEGNLYTTSELFSEEEIDDFFDCGVEDIENIIDIPMEHEKNVFGQFDEHIKKIEKTLNVTIISRDGALKIVGSAAAAEKAKRIIENLTQLSQRGNTIQEQNVDYAISLSF